MAAEAPDETLRAPVRHSIASKCYWQPGGQCASPDERMLDVHEPPADVPVRGVLLYVPGGGWNGKGGKVGPSRSVLHPMVRLMLKESLFGQVFLVGGWRVLSMDHSTSRIEDSEGGVATVVHDVRAAIRFAQRHYARPHDLPLVLVGHSSGAHIAALAALSSNDGQFARRYPAFLETDKQGLPLSNAVAGVVSLAGPLDLQAWISESDFEMLNRVPGVMGISDRVADFFGCRVAGADSLGVELPACFDEHAQTYDPIIELASPVGYLDAQDPPMYVACASQDQWVVPSAACPAGLLKREEVAILYDVVESELPGDAVSAGLASHAMTGVDSIELSRFFNRLVTANP